MQLTERVRSWLRPSRTQAQPEDVFQSLWMKTARADSTRHPFHREVLTDLDVLLGVVATAAPDTLVEVNDIPTRWDALPQLYRKSSAASPPTGCGASSSAKLLGSQRSPTRLTT